MPEGSSCARMVGACWPSPGGWCETKKTCAAPEAELAVSLELLERREVREAVRRSIDQLPEGYRNVWLLRGLPCSFNRPSRFV